MNTILISGTAKSTVTGQVEYDCIIWASKEGEQIQYIRNIDKILANYSALWAMAKANVISYFGNDNKFDDGAYTQYLDHITIRY